MRLDIDFIRSQFPAFCEPSLAEWSFFKNAGGSYMCQHVIDRASGDFDGIRQLNEMKISGDPGVIRLSFLHYRTRDEIDRLIRGLTMVISASARRRVTGSC